VGRTRTEPGEIAGALIGSHPERDPLDLEGVDLQRPIVALPDSDDDSGVAGEATLEVVVVAWHEQR